MRTVKFQEMLDWYTTVTKALRMGTPDDSTTSNPMTDEVASAVLFLASGEGSFSTGVDWLMVA
jgi:hypothetical protein